MTGIRTAGNGVEAFYEAIHDCGRHSKQDSGWAGDGVALAGALFRREAVAYIPTYLGE